MVALFFLSSALGTTIAGTLGEYYTQVPEGLYFGTLGAIAVVLGILVLVAAPLVLKLMRGVR